jgi:transcriptional regulator with XRE-family HTH domain
MIAERLRDLLASRCLSQAELARRVGLDQSTINGMVKGGQRASTKLHLIARELRTTPAYLTGETDDPGSDAPQPPILSPHQREMAVRFANLSLADQRTLLRIARLMEGGAA